MVSQSLLRSLRQHTRSRASPVFNHLSKQRLFKSTAAIDEPDIAHESETFLTGASSLYAEQMYENYCNDPNSVHETWRKYFEDIDSGNTYDEKAYNRPTVVISNHTKKVGEAGDSHLAVSTGSCQIDAISVDLVDIRLNFPRSTFKLIIF